jgi:lambda family phage tail tape measure protein
MRAFAASNPFTLIAVAVGTLVVAVAELIDTYGSFGNAMKAVGNMGIDLINTLINGFKAFGQFMGQMMTGVGKAILAGLNPFSNKSAMAELQSGFQKGVGAFKKQMEQAGPIKFKFDVKPVVKKGGKSALEALLGDEGVVDKDATGLTEQQAAAREKEALAAQQVTQQMILQNNEANKLRQSTIDMIGMESDYANLIKSNNQAESDSRKQVADLDAKIVAERAKGKDTNQQVIAQLEQQKVIVQNQVSEAQRLNQLEYQRMMYLKDINLRLQNGVVYGQLMNEKSFNAQKLKALELYGTELERFNGTLQAATTLANNMQSASNQVFTNLAKQIPTEELDSFKNKFKEYATALAVVGGEEAAGREVAAEQYAELDRLYESLIENRTQGQQIELANLRDATALEVERFIIAKKYVDDVLAKQAEIQKNMSLGAERAIADIAKQFEPYKMAQDAVALGWRKVSDALDTFIETGKFSFKDFARSILADLTKMIAQAMVFKYIFNPIMGALGLPTAGVRAMGGPVSGNKPYIVGEKGPELFVPKNAGDIIPNNKLAATAQATGTGMVNAPVTNNYITNNINAVDAKSVAQLFVENRKTLLGTVQMAQREMPYAV